MRLSNETTAEAVAVIRVNGLTRWQAMKVLAYVAVCPSAAGAAESGHLIEDKIRTW